MPILTSTRIKYSMEHQTVYSASNLVDFAEVGNLLLILLEHEINRSIVWTTSSTKDELLLPENGQFILPSKWSVYYKIAWAINPLVALHISFRFPHTSEVANKELSDLITANPTKVLHSSIGVSHLIPNITRDSRIWNEGRFLLLWYPISPIDAIALLGPDGFSDNPWVIQYAIGVLEFFPVDQVFFYIPQIVQSLRFDEFGSLHLI